MRLRGKFLMAAGVALALGLSGPLAASASQPAKPATPTAAPTAAARPPATTGATPAAAAPKPATAVAPTIAAAPPAAGGSQTISRSDFELVVMLLRSTLVALHQANITGNYTVLRDLGAPGFRDANTATRLAEIFAPIRSRGVDLSRVVLIDPNLTVAKINENGMLNIAGSLPAAPVQVNFEMLFQAVQNNWLLFGISINAEAPQTALTAPQVAPPVAAPAVAPAAVTAPVRPVPVPTPTTRP